MADKQISDLTSASALTDGSLFVLEQAGAAMKANWGMMKNYISPGVAPQYSSSATYNVGDYVIYNGQLYRCIVSITSSEAWTAAHWKSVYIASDVFHLKHATDNLGFGLFKNERDTSGYPVRIGAIQESGATWDYSNNNFCRTSTILIRPSAILFSMSDNTYSYKIYTYRTDAISSGGFVRNINEKFVEGATPSYISQQQDEIVYAVCFKLTADASHVMTSSDVSAIKSKLRVYFLTDDSLSISGAVADAKATGDANTEMYSSVGNLSVSLFKDSVNTSGWTIYQKRGINSDGSDALNNNTFCRTIEILLPNVPVLFYMSDDTYKYQVFVYNSEPISAAGLSRKANGSLVPGNVKTVISKQTSAEYIYAVRFQLSADPSHVMTSSDVSAIKSKLRVYRLTSDKLFEEKSTIIGTPSICISPKTSNSFEELSYFTLAQLYDIYDSLVTNYGGLVQRGSDLGTASDGSTKIREYVIKLNQPYVYTGEVTISKWDGTPDPVLPITGKTNEWNNSLNNPVLLLTSGVHGNEKSSCWGTALAAKYIVESDDEAAKFLRSNFEIHICPAVNPWGIENYVRRNYDDVNVNGDFGTFATPEAQAIRDWILSLKDRTVAMVDSHGTSGSYCYFETAAGSGFNAYSEMMMRFACGVQSNWAQFYNDPTYAPYFWMCKTEPGTTGLLSTYFNSLGIPGFVTETAQDWSHSSNITNWGNDKRACKLTVDMVVSSLAMLGNYGLIQRRIAI